MYKQAKEHEIYFTKTDYQQTIDKYNRDRPLAFSPQFLLIVAKAHFILGEYSDCLRVLKHIDPKYNTKILFQRQSLEFRALYLFNRQILPDVEHLRNLNQIIDVFENESKQVPGVPFKDHHYLIMAMYKQFVLFIEKQISMKVVLDNKLFKEQKELQARSQKFEGFPIYIIANQWIEDFNLALTKGQLKGEAYLCPLTNFAIINDLFEAYQYDDKLDQYKNLFLFPGVITSTVSKKYWNYLNSIINEGKEYGPVKRIYDSSSLSSSAVSKTEIRRPNRFHSLVKTIIKTQDQEIAIQLAGNKTLDEEFYVVLEKKYGIGQLRIKQDEQFNFLDLEEQSQTSLGKVNKILYFKRVQIPHNVLPKQFRQLLQYQFKPIPKENLEDPENGLKGLQNIGNSCYLNSCLQCLSFTKELSSILVTSNTLSIINFDSRDGAVLAAIADLFKNLWMKDQRKRIFPRKFKRVFGSKNIQFSERTQEDAHQFLLCVLNNLHQELKVIKSRLMRTLSKLQVTTDQKKVREYFQRHELEENKSAVMNTLRGKIHNTMDCSFCKSQSHSYDIFLALTLPVPQMQTKHMDIYFCGYDTRLTKKYRIHVDQMKDFEELLTYVKTIFRKMAGIEYYYIFGEINKENLMFREMVFITDSQVKYLTQVTIELLANKRENFDFIFYEMKKKEDNEVLMLLEYRYERDGLILGFPRLMHIQQRKIEEKLYYIDLKKDIAQNDKENFFKSFGIDSLNIKKLSQIKRSDGNPNFFDYITQVIFRAKEKLFSGTSEIFQEFNDPNIKYSIYDCFDLMRKPEVLVDSWQCGNCKKTERVEKRQLIIETSNILIIHLKRFKADYRKIKTMIDYPIKDLDIGPWIENKDQNTIYRYNLYAVCLHTGTAESGHYKAYCKHFASGIWYEFDDGSVQMIDQSDVVTPNAYVLFYRRSESQ